MSAYDCVMSARANDRPTAIDYITRIFGDSFFELHGDRRFADDKAVIGGIAELNGKPVTVIALEKGRKLKERMYRNFCAAHPCREFNGNDDAENSDTFYFYRRGRKRWCIGIGCCR